jgi:hypothetical protein
MKPSCTATRSQGQSPEERQTKVCLGTMRNARLAGTLCSARQYHVLVLVPPQSSHSWHRYPPPEPRRLFARSTHPHFHPARLCFCDHHDLSPASDGRPIGWVKGKTRSSGNPRSRSCRVEQVWAVYGVQDAGLMGVNRLQATIKTVGEIKEKK